MTFGAVLDKWLIMVNRCRFSFCLMSVSGLVSCGSIGWKRLILEKYTPELGFLSVREKERSSLTVTFNATVYRLHGNTA